MAACTAGLDHPESTIDHNIGPANGGCLLAKRFSQPLVQYNGYLRPNNSAISSFNSMAACA